MTSTSAYAARPEHSRSQPLNSPSPSQEETVGMFLSKCTLDNVMNSTKNMFSNIAEGFSTTFSSYEEDDTQTQSRLSKNAGRRPIFCQKQPQENNQLRGSSTGKQVRWKNAHQDEVEIGGHKGPILKQSKCVGGSIPKRSINSVIVRFNPNENSGSAVTLNPKYNQNPILSSFKPQQQQHPSNFINQTNFQPQPQSQPQPHYRSQSQNQDNKMSKSRVIKTAQPYQIQSHPQPTIRPVSASIESNHNPIHHESNTLTEKSSIIYGTNMANISMTNSRNYEQPQPQPQNTILPRHEIGYDPNTDPLINKSYINVLNSTVMNNSHSHAQPEKIIQQSSSFTKQPAANESLSKSNVSTRSVLSRSNVSPYKNETQFQKNSRVIIHEQPQPTKEVHYHHHHLERLPPQEQPRTNHIAQPVIIQHVTSPSSSLLEKRYASVSVELEELKAKLRQKEFINEQMFMNRTMADIDSIFSKETKNALYKLDGIGVRGVVGTAADDAGFYNRRSWLYKSRCREEDKSGSDNSPTHSLSRNRAIKKCLEENAELVSRNGGNNAISNSNSALNSMKGSQISVKSSAPKASTNPLYAQEMPIYQYVNNSPNNFKNISPSSTAAFSSTGGSTSSSGNGWTNMRTPDLNLVSSPSTGGSPISSSPTSSVITSSNDPHHQNTKLIKKYYKREHDQIKENNNSYTSRNKDAINYINNDGVQNAGKDEQPYSFKALNSQQQQGQNDNSDSQHPKRSEERASSIACVRTTVHVGSPTQKGNEFVSEDLRGSRRGSMLYHSTTSSQCSSEGSSNEKEENK